MFSLCYLECRYDIWSSGCLIRTRGKGSHTRDGRQSLEPDNLEKPPFQPWTNSIWTTLALERKSILVFSNHSNVRLFYYMSSVLIITESNDNFTYVFHHKHSRIPVCFFFILFLAYRLTHQGKLNSERLSVLAKMPQEQNLGLL